jgi:hypothetical protein
VEVEEEVAIEEQHQHGLMNNMLATQLAETTPLPMQIILV